jgi:maltose O-acetyltransferase
MTSEKEQMLAGELYDAYDSTLVEERSRARELTRLYNQTTESEQEIRRLLLAELLDIDAEGKLEIVPPFRCDYGYNISAATPFFANFGCVMLDANPIEFGRNCLLGPCVHVYSVNHPLDAETRAADLEYAASVTIGDNVWIGGQAVINPGVTVGDDAVIASGAVVIDDVPAGTLVAGNPAEVVKEIE